MKNLIKNFLTVFFTFSFCSIVVSQNLNCRCIDLKLDRLESDPSGELYYSTYYDNGKRKFNCVTIVELSILDTTYYQQNFGSDADLNNKDLIPLISYLKSNDVETLILYGGSDEELKYIPNFLRSTITPRYVFLDHLANQIEAKDIILRWVPGARIFSNIDAHNPKYEGNGNFSLMLNPKFPYYSELEDLSRAKDLSDSARMGLFFSNLFFDKICDSGLYQDLHSFDSSHYLTSLDARIVLGHEFLKEVKEPMRDSTIIRLIKLIEKSKLNDKMPAYEYKNFISNQFDYYGLMKLIKSLPIDRSKQIDDWLDQSNLFGTQDLNQFNFLDDSFDLGKQKEIEAPVGLSPWRLLPSQPDLDSLTELLLKNPQIKIEIQVHTDNRGSDQYNLTYSKKIASAIKVYINEKGVQENRIFAHGYGKIFPIIKYVTGIPYEEEREAAYQKNRRILITITDV